MKFSEKIVKFLKETSEKVVKFAKAIIADKKKLTAAIAILAIIVVALPVTLILFRSGTRPAELSFTLIDDGAAYEVAVGIRLGTPSDIIIPSEHEGLPVTKIAREGFSTYSSMTSIKIPNSVTYIGDWAFSYCSSLTSVTISRSVSSGITTLGGSYAFYNCAALVNIYVPADSVAAYKADANWKSYGANRITAIPA